MKHLIKKAFCFNANLGTRKKGTEVELVGVELDFAVDNGCVDKPKSAKKKTKKSD